MTAPESLAIPAWSPNSNNRRTRAFAQEAPAMSLDLAEAIRAIPDYPKPGIMFRDITTLLGRRGGFRSGGGRAGAALCRRASPRWPASRRAGSSWAGHRRPAGRRLRAAAQEGQAAPQDHGGDYELEYGPGHGRRCTSTPAPGRAGADGGRPARHRRHGHRRHASCGARRGQDRRLRLFVIDLPELGGPTRITWANQCMHLSLFDGH